MRNKRALWLISIRFGAGVLGALALTGCPLTDKYYIEQSSVGGGVSAGGSTSSSGLGGTAGTGAVELGGGAGTVGVELGGAAGMGGVELGGAAVGTGGVELGGTAGTGAIACDAGSCDGTCCDSGCTDLEADPNNCGACGSACPTGRECRAGQCHGWTAMTPPPATLVAREKAAYTVITDATAGDKLFIFGGLDSDGNALNSGAIYDPAMDTWTMLPQTTNVPLPRQLASAFWTGLRVYVIGGRDSASALAHADGARFDPDTNSWLATSSLPTGRVAPWGAPGASYIMVWGGLSASDTALSGGERVAYATTSSNNWTSITAGFGGVTPDRVSEAAWGYISTHAYLFGGRINGTTKSNKGFLYTASSGAWSSLPTGPSARWGAFGACDGTAFFVWGGRDDTTVVNDGYRWGATWTVLGATNAPSARWAPYRRTGWTLAFGTGDIAILGGMGLSGNPLTDGGRYNRTADTWVSIARWPSQEAHEYGVAALLNGEIFVWGGRNGATLTTTGERWLP